MNVRLAFSALLFVLFTLMMFLPACEDSSVIVEVNNSENGGSGNDPVDDAATGGDDSTRIFITDRTNRRWDITHAVNKYGFNPNKFQYGLGSDAIPPILNPQMISPGESGYPTSADDQMLVMGADLNGKQRAYRLTVMSRHEVVDEKFGDAHVAVAY